MTPVRVAVIGGGIAGLAAAWTLVEEGAETTVFDEGPIGGKIKTTEFLGHPVDEGADAFIARVPEAVELCRALGLEGDLVAPAAGRALLWTGGRLRPFPDGLVLGVPTRLRPLLGSGLLSAGGILRAALDLVLPPSRPEIDISVAGLVSRRMGTQVAGRLVDPLVGGIHAGRTEELSAQAAAPQLVAAAKSSRSLMRGLRPALNGSAPEGAEGGRPGPVFLALRGGMGRMVERLAATLRERGAAFDRRRVTTIGRAAGGGVAVTAGTVEVFDGAVVAVPAPAARSLVAAVSPVAAGHLGEIPSASVVLVTLAYPRAALPGLSSWPDCSGFLVPRSEGRLMTACSFGSAKWPEWADPGCAVLRVSAGRAGDERAMDLDDEELVARLGDEVRESLGASGRPAAVRVSRWPGGFPQYLVGHLERVSAIEAALAGDLPGVALAGSSYRGVGIPACIASGTSAARSALAKASRNG